MSTTAVAPVGSFMFGCYQFFITLILTTTPQEYSAPGTIRRDDSKTHQKSRIEPALECLNRRPGMTVVEAFTIGSSRYPAASKKFSASRAETAACSIPHWATVCGVLRWVNFFRQLGEICRQRQP